MWTSPLEFDQDNPPRIFPNKIDPDKAVLGSMMAGARLSIVMHPADAERARFLDRLIPALLENHFRVNRITHLDGGPLDLSCVMNQVVGRDCETGADTVERFFAALTRPAAGETRMTLIIDNAHLLTDQAVRYLDLIASLTHVTPVPLQLLLLGPPQLWALLPASGNLAADRVSASLSLTDEDAGSAAEPERPGRADPAPAATPLSGARSEPLAHAGKRHTGSDGRRLAWAVLAAVILLGGGLAAIHFRDRPILRMAILADAAARHFARWPGHSDPAQDADPVPPATPMEAAAGPARAASRPAADPSTAATPTTAEAITAPNPPETAEVSAVIASPQEAAPGTNGLAANAAPADASASSGARRSDEAAPAPVRMAETHGQIARPEPGAAPPVVADVITGQVSARPDPADPDPAKGVANLLARGNALLADGDVVAARLMYERAARANSGPAATALGKTYDPQFLAEIGAQGVTPDPQRAMLWYRRASELGRLEARRLLAQAPAVRGK